MTNDYNNIFWWLPWWAVCFGLLVVFMIAIEVGYRTGLRVLNRKRRRAEGDDGERSELGTIQGSMLGLLGLLLAFTYSFVSTRAETRKYAVVQEANAIGTAYLRAELVPPPVGPELQSVLREYADSRLVDDKIADDPEELQLAIAKSEAIQARIWPLAAKALEGHSPTPVDALLIQSVNDVLDMHTTRLAAGRDHVPTLVLAVLLLVATVSVGLFGYSGGIAGKRRLGLTTTLAAMLVVICFLILDIDRPRGGIIRVSQRSLYELNQNIRPAPTTLPAADEVRK